MSDEEWACLERFVIERGARPRRRPCANISGSTISRSVVSNVNTASPKPLYVHADHLNRPVMMTDQSRAKVWEASYKPFGEVQSVTGLNDKTQRFPGQWYQIETGLTYNWHRHYDGTIGRYLQADPLGLKALLSDGPSIYGYAGQSPLVYVDPTGEISAKLLRKIVESCIILYGIATGDPGAKAPRSPLPYRTERAQPPGKSGPPPTRSTKPDTSSGPTPPTLP